MWRLRQLIWLSHSWEKLKVCTNNALDRKTRLMWLYLSNQYYSHSYNHYHHMKACEGLILRSKLEFIRLNNSSGVSSPRGRLILFISQFSSSTGWVGSSSLNLKNWTKKDILGEIHLTAYKISEKLHQNDCQA